MKVVQNQFDLKIIYDDMYAIRDLRNAWSGDRLVRIGPRFSKICWSWSSPVLEFELRSVSSQISLFSVFHELQSSIQSKWLREKGVIFEDMLWSLHSFRTDIILKWIDEKFLLHNRTHDDCTDDCNNVSSDVQNVKWLNVSFCTLFELC